MKDAELKLFEFTLKIWIKIISRGSLWGTSNLSYPSSMILDFCWYMFTSFSQSNKHIFLECQDWDKLGRCFVVNLLHSFIYIHSNSTFCLQMKQTHFNVLLVTECTHMPMSCVVMMMFFQRCHLKPGNPEVWNKATWKAKALVLCKFIIYPQQYFKIIVVSILL